MENERIAILFNTIKEALDILREEKEVSLKRYRSERRLQDIVEREFERVINASIDIGARLISIKNLPKASTYIEIFDILAQKGLIHSDLAERMKDMVRFRNILTHEYFRISPEKVYEKLGLLNVFVEFCKAIENIS